MLSHQKINEREYIIEVCPKCKKISPYIPNPFYIHRCKNEGCGFKGYSSDLIKVYNDLQFEKEVEEVRTNMEKNSKISLLSKIQENKNQLNLFE
jgi:hypothetical protein